MVHAVAPNTATRRAGEYHNRSQQCCADCPTLHNSNVEISQLQSGHFTKFRRMLRLLPNTVLQRQLIHPGRPCRDFKFCRCPPCFDCYSAFKQAGSGAAPGCDMCHGCRLCHRLTDGRPLYTAGVDNPSMAFWLDYFADHDGELWRECDYALPPSQGVCCVSWIRASRFASATSAAAAV